jgi:hypothetical protein
MSICVYGYMSSMIIEELSPLSFTQTAPVLRLSSDKLVARDFSGLERLWDLSYHSSRILVGNFSVYYSCFEELFFLLPHPKAHCRLTSFRSPLKEYYALLEFLLTHERLSSDFLNFHETAPIFPSNFFPNQF